MKETNYSRKISQLILQNLSNIISRFIKETNKNFIVTLTDVRVTIDVSLAKVYFTVFTLNKANSKNLEALVGEFLNEKKLFIKKELAAKIKNKTKKLPELIFIFDDSKQNFDNISKIIADPNF